MAPAGQAGHGFTHFELVIDVYAATVPAIDAPGFLRPATALGARGAAHRDAQMRARRTRCPAMKRQPGLPFILLTLGLDALGFGLVVPIVPALVRSLTQRRHGQAARWVGALVATFAAAQFVAAPVLGGLSDRFGRRPVIILSLPAQRPNYLLLAWAPSLPGCSSGGCCAGATAASASAANAYIADVTPPELRSGRFGLVGATFGAGFVLGPALGGVLGRDRPAPAVPGGRRAGAGQRLLRRPGAARKPAAGAPPRRSPGGAPTRWDRCTPWPPTAPVGRLALGWSCMWFGLGALQSGFVLSTGLRFGWGPQENGWALAPSG